jgi:hypothetical protein
MAFTEFTVRAGGSNMNAGTLDGTAEASAAPFKTYTNGAYNNSTNKYTPAGGVNPITDGIAVGMWTNLYVDGATSGPYFAVIIAVTTTDISFSASVAFGGLEPALAASGMTLVVGGAWKGPNGTDPFPFGSIPAANFALAANGTARANLKNDQQYNVTATIAHNVAGPARFQGYTNTFGDGGKATIDGGTSGAAYTLLTTSSAGANIDLVDIIFNHNGGSGFVRGLSLSGPEFHIERCVFANMRLDGFQSNAVAGNGMGVLTECEAYGNGGSGFNMVSVGDAICDRCISHDNVVDGFVVAGNVTIINCIADTNGGQGLNTSSATGTNAIGCDFYGNTGDGIRLNNVSASRFFFKNCNIVKNGGWGINGLGAGARNGAVINCGFGSGTAANTSGTTTGLKSMTEAGSVNYPSGVTPWVDPDNGDFRIVLAAARGTGRGSFTQTASGYAGTVDRPDIGAAHVPSTLPAVGHVRSGDGFGVLGTEFVGTSILPTASQVRTGVNYGSFDGLFYERSGNVVIPATSKVRTATLYGANGTEFSGADALPATSDVRLGVGYGNNASEFTGTLSASTDYPAVGEVHSGVAYNFGALTGTRIDAPIADVREGVTYGNPASPLIGTLPDPHGGGTPLDGMVGDLGDGTGIGVRIDYPDVAALHTVKVLDSARDDTSWRTVATQVGPGSLTIPVEDTGGAGTFAVTFSRTWWVHVTTQPAAGGTIESQDYLVTPTKGYTSDIFEILVNLKHKLIRANLERVGGRVYHCTDPRPAAQTVAEYPAIFVNQVNPEVPTAVDTDSMFVDVDFQIAICDIDNRDSIAATQWLLYSRQVIYDLFSRFSTETQLMTTDPQGSGETGTGRQYTVKPGQLIPDQNGAYQDRTTFMIVSVQLERRLP